MELDIFLSYSLLDAERFRIKEIAERLSTFKEVRKVFLL